MEKLNMLIDDFIDSEIYDLQDSGNMCLDYCEAQNDFHLVSYWIDGTYDNVKYFMENNYSDEMYSIIVDKYPYDIERLKSKVKAIYSDFSERIIAYEALASILLNEFQHYPQWYSVYGSEEIDMIDFKKYHITDALTNQDEFPIIKQEDIVASMLGINYTVQPSDMYDIFAHYSDQLKHQKASLIEEVDEPIFTPDVFLTAAVVSRYKNYTEVAKTINPEYSLKFMEFLNYDNELLKDISILEYAIDDYINRFSSTPNGLPLHNEMLEGCIDGYKFIITYRIRGIKNKKTCWDDIAEISYDIPQTAEEFQRFIIQIATDFKRELNGMEKVRNTNILAIEGKYPNKRSATHGLTFTKNLNVQKKDQRGNSFKKPVKTNYSLALAEKQALYLIKKSLRYASSNPVISSSFGVDSVTTLHLLRRVNKHNFKIVFNNSHVEYPELIKFKKKLCAEWELDSKLIETKPVETYWSVAERLGFNMDRKGDRRNGRSVSEECCAKIKHIPMGMQIDKFISEGNPMQVNYTGLRAAESRTREQQVKRDNVVYYSKSWKSLRVNPIAFMSDEMVWEYTEKYNVPYCDIYDMVVYYEDVYDNINEDEYHKVYYKPRIGCMPCLIRASGGSSYLYFLRKYYPKYYRFLMIDKQLAKDLFIPGAKKLGIIINDTISNNKKNVNGQISLFDENVQNDTEELSCEDILKRYSLEDMESLIIKRPCKFLA